jgi:o-succinylbenzoate synthase
MVGVCRGGGADYSEETVDTAWLAISEWLAPRLFGVSPGRSGGDPRPPERGLPRPQRMAKAAVEMGCWALAAEMAGVSLASLLGGARSHVATGISIGIQADPAALVERARAARDLGYPKIKLKIQPGADYEFVRAVRDELGPDQVLMADANSGLHASRTRISSRSWTRAEPDHDRAAAGVRRPGPSRPPSSAAFAPPSASTSPSDLAGSAEDMVRSAAAASSTSSPGGWAGIPPPSRIHDLCQRHGVPVWCGGMLESGIGRAYNVALASLPNFSLPGDLSPSARYWARDVVHPGVDHG